MNRVLLASCTLTILLLMTLVPHAAAGETFSQRYDVPTLFGAWGGPLSGDRYGVVDPLVFHAPRDTFGFWVDVVDDVSPRTTYDLCVKLGRTGAPCGDDAEDVSIAYLPGKAWIFLDEMLPAGGEVHVIPHLASYGPTASVGVGTGGVAYVSFG